MKTSRNIARLALTATLLVTTSAAVEAASPEASWLRYPSISPDGSQIAFSYAGQIWTVSAEGGEAIPLTGGLWHAKQPIWSPDGQTIAFAADRHGQYDVFVVPAAGGSITRLTYNSASDLPMSFSPDGSEVIFTSARLGDAKADAMDAVYGLAALYERPYAVAATGGRPHPVLQTTALNVSYGPQGKMLYEDNPGVVENQWRKHHISDATRDIWQYDSETGHHEQLTGFRGEDRDPSWSADGKAFYWLSEQAGNFNIWRRDITSGTPEQVTFHERWPVRFLSTASDGTLSYAWDGGIWRLDPDAKDPVRLTITVAQGSLIDTTSIRDVTSEVTEMVVGPGGKEIAFVARGEIFVTGWDSQITRAITNTVQMEKNPAFSADGRSLIYASERNGDWDIFETRLVNDKDQAFSAPVPLDEHVLIDEDADLFDPQYSPDGGRVAYIRNRGEIRVQDLEKGTSIQALPGEDTYSYTDGDLSVHWSPDGNWLLSRMGFGSSAEVALIAADGSTRHNLSLNGFVDMRPQFSIDGSAVLWISDRYGLRSTEGQSAEMDVMGAFLTRQGWENLQKSPTEAMQAAKAEDAESAAFQPEPDGIRHRTARLTPQSGQYVIYKLLADNQSVLIVSQSNSGLINASVRNLKSGAERAVFSIPGGNVLAVEHDPEGTALFVMTPGRITRYDVATGGSSAVGYHAEINRAVRDEVSYIIRSNWRATSETFYRADMQGVDWKGVGEHYLRFAPHIYHWEDLAELEGEMDGELNASHQNPSYTGSHPLGDATGVLGLYYDTEHRGEGMRISEVISGGPADRKASPLKPGAVIMAVDGEPLTADISIDKLLNRKAGKQVRISVQPAESSETVDTIVTPISAAQEIELAYQRWVEKRRAMVSELSGGRLGYIHLRSMMTEPYRTAYGDLFGLHPDAEGVVVDIRNNGGGNLHDELVIMLTGTYDSHNRARDGHIVTRNPIGRWTKPSIVVQNGGSYSDGSVFPMLYKKKAIGKIVGDRTPGTGTAVSEVPQLEAGLRYRVPEMGFQLADNDTWFENTEIEPDILVHNNPNSVSEGRDVQLEAAVKAMLEQLD